MRKTTLLNSTILMLASLLVLLGAGALSPRTANADENPFAVHEGGEMPRQQQPKLGSAKEYFARGLKNGENKDYQASLSDYTEAIKLNPHYAEAYGNRGAAKFNMQDFRGAIADYDEALKTYPTNKALIDLKAKAEESIKAQSQPQTQQVSQEELARRRALHQQALLGGDLSDPSTILMMNAKRRGLIPQNTPEP
jgi:tetratricopeptide (TPR) repeat protein